MPDPVSRLALAMEAGLPGESAQLSMCPPFRMGLLESRPPNQAWRQSAVLILLHPGADGGRRFYLIERSIHRGSHRGEMGLPGGAIEAGESALEAALREAEEELGLDGEDVSAIRVLGALSALRVPPSGFEIHPFVAVLDYEPGIRPSKEEVAACYRPTLSELLDPGTARTEPMEFQGRTWDLPFYCLEGTKVWGATAMILAELKSLLLDPSHGLADRRRPSGSCPGLS